MKEIIEGTPIASEFKEIYAASFCYDEHGVACWPAMAVNYTSKTQFLFRINKGVLDVTEHRAHNEFMPEEKRRVPFSNMIYIGDGLTDVPSMKLTKLNGGHSIAVWQDDSPRQRRNAAGRPCGFHLHRRLQRGQRNGKHRFLHHRPDCCVGEDRKDAR